MIKWDCGLGADLLCVIHRYLKSYVLFVFLRRNSPSLSPATAWKCSLACVEISSMITTGESKRAVVSVNIDVTIRTTVHWLSLYWFHNNCNFIHKETTKHDMPLQWCSDSYKTYSAAFVWLFREFMLKRKAIINVYYTLINKLYICAPWHYSDVGILCDVNEHLMKNITHGHSLQEIEKQWILWNSKLLKRQEQT